MAKCKHDNSVRLDTVDIFEEYEIDIAITHGDISSIQQLDHKPRVVTIERRWCAECSVVYGTISAAN